MVYGETNCGIGAYQSPPGIVVVGRGFCSVKPGPARGMAAGLPWPMFFGGGVMCGVPPPVTMAMGVSEACAILGVVKFIPGGVKAELGVVADRLVGGASDSGGVGMWLLI